MVVPAVVNCEVFATRLSDPALGEWKPTLVVF